MGAPRFLAYLTKCHAMAGGKGRITWAVDLELWKPTLTNGEQDPKSWAAVYEVTPAAPALIAHGRSGEEALASLLVAMVRRSGTPEEVAASALAAIIPIRRQT